MGWGYGEVNGKPVGYTVPDVCNESGCDRKIDRGLSYVCGDMHGGGEFGCGGYFCAEHMLVGKEEQLCKKCYEAAP